jgi:phosphate starvation-inducible protein PhoH and related proteins
MEILIKIESNLESQNLFGKNDEKIRLLEEKLKVKIYQNNLGIVIKGPGQRIKKAQTILNAVLGQLRQNKTVTKLDLNGLLTSQDSKKGRVTYFMDNEEKLSLSFNGKTITPRTETQKEYVEAIKKYDIVFGVGPAGTGKTYLAMAMAVEALKTGKVRRVILTRPAIEAGENLGYLPGDMYEKISPYLRPLYDAIYDMMDAEKIEKYLETGVIEVAPLAYMRGRTLNDAFIILDEAQNCTTEQMKMFLTRLGFDSKTVITGDPTQSDLLGGKSIGLLQAIDILKDIEGIKFINFSGVDVVRHELVQMIIEAYDKTNKKIL